MTVTFIVRLLDEAQQLLAWARVPATARPQDRGASCPFWPNTDTAFMIEQAGRATSIAIHWPDLDVARIQTILEPADVRPGQIVRFAWIEPVWLVAGMRDVPLPPVTEHGAVRLTPPPAALGAVSP
jgi:hypothetical protein